jgi:hypothetical protein
LRHAAEQRPGRRGIALHQRGLERFAFVLGEHRRGADAAARALQHFQLAVALRQFGRACPGSLVAIWCTGSMTLVATPM